jgi:hypothetical protein
MQQGSTTNAHGTTNDQRPYQPGGKQAMTTGPAINTSTTTLHSQQLLHQSKANNVTLKTSSSGRKLLVNLHATL